MRRVSNVRVEITVEEVDSETGERALVGVHRGLADVDGSVEQAALDALSIAHEGIEL